MPIHTRLPTLDGRTRSGLCGAHGIEWLNSLERHDKPEFFRSGWSLLSGNAVVCPCWPDNALPFWNVGMDQEQEDREAAKEWCWKPGNVPFDGRGGHDRAFLAGIEHERKRLRDKMNGPYGLGPTLPEDSYSSHERFRKMVCHIMAAHRRRK